MATRKTKQDWKKGTTSSIILTLVHNKDCKYISSTQANYSFKSQNRGDCSELGFKTTKIKADIFDSITMQFRRWLFLMGTPDGVLLSDSIHICVFDLGEVEFFPSYPFEQVQYIITGCLKVSSGIVRLRDEHLGKEKKFKYIKIYLYTW